MDGYPRGAQQRAALLMLLALAVWSSLAVGVAYQPSYGEEEAKEAAAQGEEAAPAKEGGEGKAEPKQTKSYVAWFIESSGFIGLVILILSIYFVATVARMFFELRPQVVAPPELTEEVERLIQERNIKGAFELVQEDESFLGRVLTTGISQLPNGMAHARDSMERVGDAETVDMERKISMLAVLGTLGPMIGLLGTLKGMIASFSVIALSDVQLKASQVAGGISEALLLTFEGVGLSVPAIYFFALFRNRVSHLSVRAMLQAEETLQQIAHVAREKKPAAAGAAPASSSS